MAKKNPKVAQDTNRQSLADIAKRENGPSSPAQHAEIRAKVATLARTYEAATSRAINFKNLSHSEANEFLANLETADSALWNVKYRVNRCS